MNYDYRVSLLVYTPMFIGSTFVQYSLLFDLDSKTDNSARTSAMVKQMVRSLSISLVVSLSNYLSQKQVTEVTLEKLDLKKNQQSLNDLFMSQMDGILVFSEHEEDLLGTGKGRAYEQVNIEICNNQLCSILSVNHDLPKLERDDHIYQELSEYKLKKEKHLANSSQSIAGSQITLN